MIHVVSFEVFGWEPVPWTVPNICKTQRGQRFTHRPKKTDPSRSKLSLEDWQQIVSKAAKAAMNEKGISNLLTSQVRIDYKFFCETPEGCRSGQLWNVRIKPHKTKPGEWSKISRNGKTDPDITNLVKAVEDAIQDSVIADDCTVRCGSQVALYGSLPGVSVSVWEIEDSDYPGDKETET
jgi:Holliday junction resolvase RusA-like endonuclease